MMKQKVQDLAISEDHMFLVFLVPSSLSYDPYCEGHQYSIEQIWLAWYFTVNESVTISRKKLPVWNIHQSNTK